MNKKIGAILLTAVFMAGIIAEIFEDFQVNGHQKMQDEGQRTLLINEIMSSNGETIADRDGDYEDWIEIYNNSKQRVNLAGYYLSDDENDLQKWQFPAITMLPDSYLMVWASGKDKMQRGEIHTNFSISAEGEPLILTKPDGETVVDFVAGVPIPRDVSYGRFPKGSDQWSFFHVESITPGGENVEPIIAPQNPEFSQLGGFYNKPLELILNSLDQESTIYYTLDGSEPRIGAPSTYIYQGPIKVDSRKGDVNNISMIPTNQTTGMRGWVKPNGEVAKATVVRAKAVIKGIASDTITQTYFIDKNSQNRYSLPVISLSTDNANLFGADKGIYVAGNHINFTQRGVEWERPMHIEFYENDGSLAFSQDAGVRIHGGYTRYFSQKSLRLYSRSEYGTSRFNYQFFEDKPVEDFNRFLLRSSGNDWNFTMFRDGAMQSLLKGLEIDFQYYRPVIVFINGEYWGIHNLRDRLDNHYLETHYGGHRDDFVILEGKGSVYSGEGGDEKHYTKMLKFIAEKGVKTEKNYSYIQTQMDVDNYMTYFLSHIYFNNMDWPYNNVKYWRADTKFDSQAPYGLDGRWRWMVYDTDFGFGLAGPAENDENRSFIEKFEAQYGNLQGPEANTLKWVTQELNGVILQPWPNQLFNGLLENKQFKDGFINRAADLLNTNFNDQYVVSVIDELKGNLDPEMAEHINRWGKPASIEEWNENVKVMQQFAQKRTGYMREHILEHFQLSGLAKVTLKNDASQGSLRINSLEIFEDLPGMDSAGSWTGQYFQDVPVEITATPKMGYRFVGWEGEASGKPASFKVVLTKDFSAKAIFELDKNNPQVEVPDMKLKAEILKVLGKKSIDLIFAREMASFEKLDVRGKEIENIEGLQYAVNLVDLNLRENKIKDISPLSKLVKLTRLTLRENRVVDLTPLAKLVKIDDLSIHSNLVQDISPLTNLVELAELTLRENEITDITPLQGLSKLNNLNIRDNKITSIEPLRELENLQGKGSRLNLEGNEITDFAPVAHYYKKIEDTDFEL